MVLKVINDDRGHYVSMAFEEPQQYALKRAHRSHTSAAETKIYGDLRVCH